jgi:cytidylate kinase
MSVVIISKGSYSHGGKVAEGVAQKLGYGCFSRDILIDVSKKFNISELRLIRAVEDAPAFLEKYTFGREKYIAYIRAAILENLAKDNMVYHGFAGHFFIHAVSHILKVRIIADMEERLMYMMKRENVPRAEAIRLVKNVDEERSKWSVKLYGIDTWDCRLYDLVINIGKITIDDAVDLICQTVKVKAFQTTPESQKRIEELTQEALLKLEDKDLLSPFFEPMRDNPWGRKRNINKD